MAAVRRGEPAVEVESRQRHPHARSQAKPAPATCSPSGTAGWRRAVSSAAQARPHRGVEHQRRVVELLEYRRQQRRQIAGRCLGDSGDVKPCEVTRISIQVTAAGAGAASRPGGSSRIPSPTTSTVGCPALGKDVVVHADERFDERGSVGKTADSQGFRSNETGDRSPGRARRNPSIGLAGRTGVSSGRLVLRGHDWQDAMLLNGLRCLLIGEGLLLRRLASSVASWRCGAGCLHRLV